MRAMDFPECAPGPWSGETTGATPGCIHDSNGDPVCVFNRWIKDEDAIAIRDFILARVNSPATSPVQSSPPGSFQAARGVLKLRQGLSPEDAVRESREDASMPARIEWSETDMRDCEIAAIKAIRGKAAGNMDYQAIRAAVLCCIEIVNGRPSK